MQKIKPALKKMLMAIVCLSTVPAAQATTSLGHTRVIFNGDEEPMTLSIANDNRRLPYLAQTWVKSKKREEIATGPIAATPSVQRLESGSKSMVRLTSTPDISHLPQDRESLFCFSLREISSKDDKANVLQITLQTKIELLYRPRPIKIKPSVVWQDRLVLNKTSGGYRTDNPTPYYVIVIGTDGSEEQAGEGKPDAVMLAPKSTQTVKSGTYNAPYLSYINDYGGRLVLQLFCSDNRYTVAKK